MLVQYHPYPFKLIMAESPIQTRPSNSNVLDYLMLQNKRLSQQNQDLRELIKMNKIEIDVLSKNNTKNKYIEILSNYRVANENNQKKIDILQAKIEELVSEKFMQEQLYKSAQNELKAEEELHKDRVKELQQIIQDFERKMVVMERSQKTYDTLTGFVEKNREIYNPTQQAIEFKAKQQQMNEYIQILKMQIQRGKENEDNLLKINGILRHKVVTLQAKLAMPSKNFGDILDKSLKRLMMYFIETQRRLLTGEESDSQGQEDLELIAPELATYFGQENLRRQRDYNIPHIDLLKIRGSVATNNDKIKGELLKRNHLTMQQKINRLQIQLDYTRRQLTKHIIDLRQQIDRRKILQRICDELQSRSQLLIASNEQYQQKLSKLTRKIKQSKEKQMKYIELDDTINDISTTIKMDNNYVEKKEPKEVKVANPSFDIYDTPEEYKVHLELLARDLARNKKVQNLEHLSRKKEHEVQEEWKPKLKRSTSNPFLYFNQRREEIMGCNEDINSNHQENMRLEQTEILAPNMRMDHGENLDDIYI